MASIAASISSSAAMLSLCGNEGATVRPRRKQAVVYVDTGWEHARTTGRAAPEPRCDSSLRTGALQGEQSCTDGSRWSAAPWHPGGANLLQDLRRSPHLDCAVDEEPSASSTSASRSSRFSEAMVPTSAPGEAPQAGSESESFDLRLPAFCSTSEVVMEEKINASDAYLEKVNYHALAEWMAAEVRSAAGERGQDACGLFAFDSKPCCHTDSITHTRWHAAGPDRFAGGPRDVPARSPEPKGGRGECCGRAAGAPLPWASWLDARGLNSDVLRGRGDPRGRAA